MEIGKTFCGRTDGRTDTPEFQSTRSLPRRWPKNHSPNFMKSSAHVTCGRGSVFLWRQFDTLFTSGSMDDVTFSHKYAYRYRLSANYSQWFGRWRQGAKCALADCLVLSCGRCIIQSVVLWVWQYGKMWIFFTNELNSVNITSWVGLVLQVLRAAESCLHGRLLHSFQDHGDILNTFHKVV